MKAVSQAVLDVAPSVTVLFVTSLRSPGPLTDLGPEGVINDAQSYTRDQAEEIIRSLQWLGVRVVTFFSEAEFVDFLARGQASAALGRTIVYSTAEGGAGPGRRALIPSLCNFYGLPIVNSGAHACSIARHKFHANAVLQKCGVRVPSTWQFDRQGWTAGSAPPEGTRVIVKPSFESMGIGVDGSSVYIVDGAFAETATSKLHQFRQPFVVQEFVTGEEVGVPLIRLGQLYALPPVIFRRRDGRPFGDQPKTFTDEVVEDDVSRRLLDPGNPVGLVLARQARLAFDALGMAGAARMDFRVDADGRTWLFDTNESPPPLGGTAFSVAFEALGLDLAAMLAVWLGSCLNQYQLLDLANTAD